MAKKSNMEVPVQKGPVHTMNKTYKNNNYVQRTMDRIEEINGLRSGKDCVYTPTTRK